MHVHLVAPSNEDSTYIKPLWAATLAAHTPRRRRADLPRRRARAHRSRRGVRRAGSRGHQRQLEDRGARLRHRRRLPGPGQQGRARRHPRDGAPRRGPPARRRGRVRRGRVALAGRRARREERASSATRARSPLASIYKHDEMPQLEGLPRPRRDLFRSLRYVPFDVVQTTRGCPFPCEFCSVSTYNGTTFRFRPVPEVIAELEEVRPAHPLRRRQRDDPHEVQPRALRGDGAAQEALGRAGVARRAPPRGEHRGDGARRVPRALHRLRVGGRRGRAQRRQEAEQAAEVSGRSCAASPTTASPSGGASSSASTRTRGDSFERTVEFCVEAKITMALFALLTPYPGTPPLQAPEGGGPPHQGRLVAQPGPRHRRAVLSADAGCRAKGCARAGSGPGGRCTRSARSAGVTTSGMDHSWIQNVAYWPINLMMHELAEKKIAGGDRAWRKHRTLDVPFGL